ncbi:Zn-ribbon domain-containing OB-fold protein [Sporosarcina soli]|uniref:Zn-ribbon domain-containing OB-fold protein n=1 Tax=Sporosarcina soli TaxID=334736 RepID=A0ABW0TJS9_9BACL
MNAVNVTEETLFRPLPKLDSVLFKPFLEGATKGKLLVQECQQTKKKIWPPRLISPYAPDAELRWVPIEGKGKVYTFNVVHRAFFPYYKEKVPYAIVIVELEDGIRMLGNTMGINPNSISIGMPMEVAFEKVDEEIVLVHWQPQKDD